MAVGIAGIIIVQRVLMPKWNYPTFKENISYGIETFFSQEKNVDDAIFLGTSHASYNISPMEIYKDYGIVSYNLGTSIQQTDISLMLLQEMFRTQQPKVVILDVSELFFSDEESDTAWRYVVDSMPGVTRKIIAAIAYAKAFKTDFFRHLLRVIYPLSEYHSRWKELTWIDFRDFFRETDHYSAGYYLDTNIIGARTSVETMNYMAGKMNEAVMLKKSEYQYGNKSVIEDENELYNPVITEKNRMLLEEIRSLCEKHDASLLLVKMPVVYLPNFYASSWTQIRSDYMKNFAQENGYTFIDLLYDVDLDIDQNVDYSDGGAHFNYLGGKKVSAFLGEYLKTHYKIQPKICNEFDKNMPLYNKLTSVAEMELETDLPQYLSRLSDEKEGLVICMVASEDMRSGLSDNDIGMLSELGFQTKMDTELSSGDAFVAVIDRGEVVYEGVSNRVLHWSDRIGNGIQVSLKSSGWYTDAQTSAMINGHEYVCNGRGLNIVVIDRETGLVIDSVVFDTVQEEHSVQHKDSVSLFNEYWLRIRNSF